MKNVYRSVKLSRKNSEWISSNRGTKTYYVDEIDEITEEVSKVFDEMKDEYNLKTDEIEKPISHKKD